MLNLMLFTMEDYEILELIGEGSFGRVYKGLRKRDNQVYQYFNMEIYIMFCSCCV